MRRENIGCIATNSILKMNDSAPLPLLLTPSNKGDVNINYV